LEVDVAGRKKTVSGLSHVDSAGRPMMVDVAAKAITARTACAVISVHFPDTVAEALHAQGLRTAKGAVLDTAIIAGTMAVKNTAGLIPFCHPLAIESCAFDVQWPDRQTLQLRCTVSVSGKTGVEMEALTGASVAALTVYDMCKALSHEIVIGPLHLLAKRGGKRAVGVP
jgi:cyclic pyranopterin phosphate synthase